MSNDPKGYYSDIGVSPHATIEEIKSIYRALAKIYHPDINKDRAAAVKFRKITEAYEILSDPQKKATYDSSEQQEQERPAPETKTRPKRDPVDPILCSRCGKITAQPRFLVFRQVISFILLTRMTPRHGIFCSECAGKVAFQASAISAIFGWWAIPWGPIQTVKSILINAFGGECHKEIDEQLLWQNAIAFLDLRKFELSMSLAASLTESKNSQIAQGAKHLVGQLTAAKCSLARLKSPWRFNVAGVGGQLLMGCAVPAIAWVVVAQALEASSPRPSTWSARPNLPATKPATSVAAINLCTQMPRNGQVLDQRIRQSLEGHRLTVKNGSSGAAIVKLRYASGGLAASFSSSRI